MKSQVPRRAKITNWSKDDLFVTISYTQANGERVKARFSYLSWIDPPQEALHHFHKAMQNGFVTYSGRSDRREPAALHSARPRPQPAPQPAQEGPCPEGSATLA